MPPPEQRALLALLALAVAGQLVRHLLTHPGEAPGQVQLLSTLSPGSPLAQRDSAMQQARPLESGERIDVDQASAPELARLPKIGPRLAKTIVADREEHGSFGSTAGLDRVPGVGPGLLKSIEPHVVFSGGSSGEAGQRVGGAATLPEPSTAGTENAFPLPRLPASPLSPPLNINTATASDLDALPGIGPSKAAAILQYREQHGSFTAIEELSRVSGFGPALVSRLAPRLTVR